MSREALRLMRLMRPFAGWMTLAAVLGAATVGSSIGLMATSAYLLSAAALHPSIAELGLAIVGVRFFGLARGSFRYLERYVSHSVNLRLLASLRTWFYRSVEPLAPGRLTHARAGDLLARAVGDIETLEDFFVRVVAPPAVAIVVGAGTAWLLGAYDKRLALALLAFMTLTGIVLPVLVRRAMRGPGGAFIARRADWNAEVVDTIQGMADLVAFGAAAERHSRAREIGQALAAFQRRTVWIQAAQTAAGGLLGHLAMWTVLGIAVAGTAAGRYEGVVLGALALATLASFEAMLPLPAAAQALEGSLAAARRLFALSDTEPTVREPGVALAASDRRGGLSLEVRGLTFSYSPSDPLVLRGVSFRVAAGGSVAIVGPSGAGKTTLANLLLRFWEYAEGEISLNGVEIRSMASDEVRRCVAVVAQQTYFFNATLRENLLLARPEARADELLDALRRAQLDAFVRALPQGLETPIGERGLALSAGERQRLAIARALLRDAPLLILDEPTANLDPTTEQHVLQVLEAAMPGRTTLLITHRLVGLERMDEILVLDRGRIVERGRHAELARTGGLYQRMRQLQNRAWDVLGPSARPM